MRGVICIAAALSTAVGSAAAARTADADVDAAVHRALAAQGPIVTPAEQAEIDAMCGMAASSAPRNHRFEQGALVCPDGRTIRNDRTRRMETDITTRAKAYAKAAVNDPAVKAAISRLTDERVHAALASVARER